MPSLAVSKSCVLEALGDLTTAAQFEDCLFDYGIELDDIYEEDGKTMYKLDIAANRYDLLCQEGIVNAFRAYLGNTTYIPIMPTPPKVTVYKLKTHERQFIACGIIRNIKFNQSKYDSFIGYQDKLHSSIGRNRSIVSLGTHDLDKIGGSIVYKSINTSEYNFTPLGSKSQIKVKDLKQHCSGDKKLSKYFNLQTEEGRSVAFLDVVGDAGESNVISIPPILNSDITKISVETQNIFVEVTGTDFEKVNTALKLVLSAFPGESTESVLIKSVNAEDGADVKTIPVVSEIITPIFHNNTYKVMISDINKKVNLSLTGEEVKRILEKMMHTVTLNGEYVVVRIPDVRSDILHVCDVIEDVAVGYGFNNFIQKVPQLYTVGTEDAMNKFTDKIRGEFALMGFTEVLTLTLLSKSENFVGAERQVELSNPKSREYEVVRTSLLPGILKSVASNLHGRIPIKLFEAADIVKLDESVQEGARNTRHLCGCIASNTGMLEELQGPLSQLLEKCGLTNYTYSHLADQRYLENQAATVAVEGHIVGSIGVLHPSVCTKFRIPYAASAFEINLDVIFDLFMSKL